MGKSGNPAKRAMQEATALEPAVEYDPTPVDEDGVEDFDAFWTAQDDRKRPGVRIMGEVVELPAAMPLEFDLLAKRLQNSSKEKDIRRMVACLFGDEQMDRWAKAGMDVDQFKVLLAWAPQRIAGGTMSMHQVAALLAEQEKESGEA